MKKRLLLFAAIMLLSLGVFVACSSNDEGQQATNDKNDISENEKKEKSNSSKGEFQDQLDLKIGDTAQVETTLGKYEITIDSVKKEDTIDGEESQVDYFFVADATIKNIGEETIDANESKDILEITSSLEGSGFSDVASFFENFEVIEGTIEPGESITGQVLFEEEEASTYYIRFSEGLVAAGALTNQAIWTFTLEEVGN